MDQNQFLKTDGGLPAQQIRIFHYIFTNADDRNLLSSKLIILIYLYLNAVVFDFQNIKMISWE